MQTELYSVSKIFTDNLFRIPDYQRGYSWTEKHLKDFWIDLDQLELGKNHYTGVLTLEEVPAFEHSRWEDDSWIIQSKHFRPYYVVDGQQRLTTIIILLQTILERIDDTTRLNYTSKADILKRFIFESKDNGISKSFIFGYEKDNPSYEFLKTNILQRRSDSHSSAEETIYTHNLIFAKEFFRDKVAALDVPALEVLYTRVTQHLLFNIYTISEGIDVFVAFETMNNRGKPLSHLELLKNRLIFLSTKCRVESVERERLRKVINEAWKTVYHYLGKNKERPLNDDSFLLTHFLLYFGPQLLDKGKNDDEPATLWRFRRGGYYKDYLLDDIFTVRNIFPATGATEPPLSVAKIYEYAHDIKSCVQIYYQAHNAHDTKLPDEDKIALERLRRLSFAGTDLIVSACLLQIKDSRRRAAILTSLERLLFLGTLVMYGRTIEALDIIELGIRLRKGELPADRILQILDEKIKEILKETKFSSLLSEWTKRQGYYDWRGVKYFLFEYEQHLQLQTKSKREKLLWKEFAREKYEDDFATVEHIYPQKATDPRWRENFGRFTVRERNLLRHSLGNLLPLCKPKNSSLRNKCFEEKKSNEANKVGYVYGCYSENEVAQLDDWTADTILARGQKLLEFMETRWGIKIGDHREKTKALGLDFLADSQGKR